MKAKQKLQNVLYQQHNEEVMKHKEVLALFMGGALVGAMIYGVLSALFGHWWAVLLVFILWMVSGSLLQYWVKQALYTEEDFDDDV